MGRPTAGPASWLQPTWCAAARTTRLQVRGKGGWYRQVIERSGPDAYPVHPQDRGERGRRRRGGGDGVVHDQEHGVAGDALGDRADLLAVVVVGHHALLPRRAERVPPG